MSEKLIRNNLVLELHVPDFEPVRQFYSIFGFEEQMYDATSGGGSNLGYLVLLRRDQIGNTMLNFYARGKEGKITKPIVALIAGQFAEQLPQDTVLGHAGAIVVKGRGSAASKIKALQEAGVHIANTPEDIPIFLHTVLD